MTELDPVTHGSSPIPDMPAWLADYIAIRELSARYNCAVDDCRFAEFANCFTADGVFEIVGLARFAGRRDIEQNVSKFGFGTMHLSTDPTIEISGDSAVQVCSVLVANRQQNRARFRFLTTGRYHDDLVRTPDGWRFARRRIDTDLDITIMAATIAGKNFFTRRAMAGAARAMLTGRRLTGRGWERRYTS